MSEFEDQAFRPEEWDDALLFAPDPLFKNVIAARYICQLAELAQHFRRGYVGRREPLSTPRGRIDAASAGRSEATGQPTVTCAFDDFDTDTPLHRVLVAAMHCATVTVQEEGEQWSVIETASALRVRMSAIEPYPAALARALAIRLRLHATQRERWHNILRLSQAVLNTWAPIAAHEEAQEDPTPDLTVPSASLWEKIIEQALKTKHDPASVLLRQ